MFRQNSDTTRGALIWKRESCWPEPKKESHYTRQRHPVCLFLWLSQLVFFLHSLLLIVVAFGEKLETKQCPCSLVPPDDDVCCCSALWVKFSGITKRKDGAKPVSTKQGVFQPVVTQPIPEGGNNTLINNNFVHICLWILTLSFHVRKLGDSLLEYNYEKKSQSLYANSSFQFTHNPLNQVYFSIVCLLVCDFNYGGNLPTACYPP